MIVKFKSIPEMFKKEKDGRKPNTLRKVDKKDARFANLKRKNCHTICIENTETKEKFLRSITDVSFWDDWVIISWRVE